MESPTLLLLVLLSVVVLFVAAAASSGGGVDACVPGDARCDATGRVLGVCTQDGRWTRLRECEEADCFEAPCSPHNLTRAYLPCYEQFIKRCASDCSGIETCYMIAENAGLWTITETCSPGYICVRENGVSECTVNAINQKCKSGSVKVCGSPGKYPAFNCQEYYVCEDGATYGKLERCGVREKFDPCKEECVEGSSVCGNGNPCSGIATGSSPTIIADPYNKALFSLCYGSTTTLYRCNPGEIYSAGACTAGDACSITP